MPTIPLSTAEVRTFECHFIKISPFMLSVSVMKWEWMGSNMTPKKLLFEFGVHLLVTHTRRLIQLFHV